MGYVLYVGEPTVGVVIGLGSIGATNNMSRSHLGELSGVVWALEITKKTILGLRIVSWTNSESVYQRSNMKISNQKKLLDVRVGHILSWIWEIFLGDRLSLKKFQGECNREADVLSR